MDYTAKKRSSHRRKVFLKMLEPLFNNMAGLKAYRFIKKRLQHSCLPIKYVKLLRTPILKNICEWLLLKELTLLRIRSDLLKKLLKHTSHSAWSKKKLKLFWPFSKKKIQFWQKIGTEQKIGKYLSWLLHRASMYLGSSKKKLDQKYVD